ncbi:MAG: 2-oxo acid dehydrogenase subunit E2 [Oscillospiraceae bacterium]|nr:2-oxo acid dehydrogenase subunit E2 [Oscillospiraceae bacterium]
MAKVVVMPKLGLTMTEGTVSKWLKKVGDEIKSGEPFFEVETDKLTNTIEANTDGVVRHFFVEEGTTVPVLDKVAIIAAADEDISALLGGAPAAAAAPEAPAAAAPAASAAPVRAPGERVVAAPAAKKLAKELGIDLALVPGTGPNGRITLDDVKNWKPAPAAPAAPAAEEAPKTKASPLAAAVAKDLGIDLDKIGAKDRVLAEDILRYLESTREKAPEEAPREEVVPMNGMRKAIAKNMLNSHMTSPTVTANLSVDMSAMKAYREQLKAKEIKVSYTDLLVKFIAKALTEFPLLNCSVEDNKIVYKHYVNMGVAVALDNGLVVPNVPDADKKRLTEISKEIKELAKLAREGGLPMEKLRGGTFTITNLGMYGIESFTPIINQPEVAILGVTTMEDRAVVRGGEIVIRPMMTLSLTFDHRVVDGSVAAEFLQRVKALLENPALMLA